jgi:hypothetical protein
MAGTFDCTMGEPVCVAVRMMPEGTPCGPGVACDPEGGCDICLEGATCDSGDPCTRGAVACVADEPICIVADVLPEGTPCGASGLCDATATCSECVSGSACRLSDGCVVGAVECATGEAICAPIENLPAGTPCGAFGTCDGAGLCIEA